jgi:phosphoglycolate phosphatase-like HAD superfamily hydrolase
MVVYKEFESVRRYSGIIFDCDGVLIDASGSYDKALSLCTRAIYSIPGFDVDDGELSRAIGELRKLGTFNNDWDTLDVLVAFLYSKHLDTSHLDEITRIKSLSDRLRSFESLVVSKKEDPMPVLPIADLTKLVSSLAQGATRAIVCKKLLGNASFKKFDELVSYPKPVGESFLATLYDEIVYGKSIFKQMYGIDCATKTFSDPGLISNEKKLVDEESLGRFYSASGGNLGVITGRPMIPTLHTMGSSFTKWFTKPAICLFTGDYSLDSTETKPSPKPLLKVKGQLPDTYPLLYVGDSGEDVLMVKNANKTSDKRILFAGIANTENKAEYFQSEKDSVDCIVSDVNELGALVAKEN